MSLIFDNFPSETKAKEFAAACKELFGKDAQVFTDVDEANDRPRPL